MPSACAIAAASAFALRFSSRGSGSATTSEIADSVSRQRLALPMFCTSFAHTDCRMSSGAGDDIPDFSSAARSSRSLGDSRLSGAPITSMLLFGTKLRITPGSTTSFAEYTTPPTTLAAGTLAASFLSGWGEYHHGMPFCAKTTKVSGPRSGAAASANTPSRFAFSVTKTASCLPIFPVLTFPWMISSPCSSLTPRVRIASRCAPRATTETSCPLAARRAARCPPTAPAPNTQIRMHGF